MRILRVVYRENLAHKAIFVCPLRFAHFGPKFLEFGGFSWLLETRRLRNALVLQAIDNAAELGVEVTWYQTIWKILGVMKLTRNAIWGMLHQDFGHAPTDKSIDCLGDFRTFTTKYRRLMQVLVFDSTMY